MQLGRRSVLVLLFLTCALSACRTKQEGAIEGSIAPPAPSARITVLQNGNEIMVVPVGPSDGKFRITLAAGTYSIKVSVPQASYPFQMSDITVKPGETTALPLIELTPPTGNAVLAGKVLPLLRDAAVTLLYEGKERAAVHPDQDGNYEIRELPAGAYEVRVQAAGRANDFSLVTAADGQKIVQNAVLFPVSPIDGVDWTSGKIRATGIGMPPQNAPTVSVGREMAKRAALADARRNMLRIIEQIRQHADPVIKTAMGNPGSVVRIQGFLQGSVVASERNVEGNKIELILELPLNGSSGLSRCVSE